MKYLPVVIFFILLTSCGKDIPSRKLKEIEVKVEIRRFEQDLFGIDPDTVSLAIPWLYDTYGDFYEVFGYHVIGIGTPYEKAYTDKLKMFLSDEMNREVLGEVNRVFPDLSLLEEEFEKAFRRLKYFFPEEKLPQLVSFTSGFNYPGFTVSDYLGIGLDMYLGADCSYYRDLRLSEYLTRNMRKERIPLEALNNWVNGMFPYNDSIDNVLSVMIHEGKIVYFLQKLFPDLSAGEILGFSEENEKWVLNNEEQMWVYLIEHKLLYSNSIMDIRKLTGPAPYTSFFTGESPGRAVIFNGYRLVSEFARRHPKMSLKEIMKLTDYQGILRESRYNPR